MKIVACRYQTAKDKDAEDGMAVLCPDKGDILNVLSDKGILITEIWDVKLCYHVFNLTLVW